jgi:hypothetical protein
MTWESQPAWMWLAIEAHVAVMCASAPALKIFFKHTIIGSRTDSEVHSSTYLKQARGKNVSGPSSMEKASFSSRHIGKTSTWEVYSEHDGDEHELVGYRSGVQTELTALPKFEPFARESWFSPKPGGGYTYGGGV